MFGAANHITHKCSEIILPIAHTQVKAFIKKAYFGINFHKWTARKHEFFLIIYPEFEKPQQPLTGIGNRIKVRRKAFIPFLLKYIKISNQQFRLGVKMLIK